MAGVPQVQSQGDFGTGAKGIYPTSFAYEAGLTHKPLLEGGDVTQDTAVNEQIPKGVGASPSGACGVGFVQGKVPYRSLW